MSYTKRNLEELNIMDDFLMSAVASNQENGEDFCRLILSTLLEREIGQVRVTVQRTIPALTPNLRGIRMDVEVLEELDSHTSSVSPVWNIYDLEPHIHPDIHLPRHNRFYQARIDSRYMQSGEHDFSKMPDLYMITITPYDPFGHNYMVYRIQSHCQELPDMLYDDGIQHLYFYTGGTRGGTPAIRAMLDYFQDSRAENAEGEVLQKIHQYVSQTKILPEVRDEFMHLEQYVRERIALGLDQAKEELKIEWKNQIRDEVKSEVRDEVKNEVRDEVKNEVRDEVKNEVRDEVKNEVRDEVKAEIANQVAQETELRIDRERRIQDILDLLEDFGELPSQLLAQIQTQADPLILKKWLKLAAKADSITAFAAGIE